MPTDPRKWSPRGGLLGSEVVVLVYEHKHGTDVSVYTTMERAYQAVVETIREFVDELELGDQEEVQKLLDEEKIPQAIQTYMDAANESFDLRMTHIL